MNTVAHAERFVGLDYHQNSVQVCVLDASGKQLINRACRNDWRAIVEAVTPLGVVRRAAVEACGGSADLAQELIDRASWRVDLAHPGYVERMKQSPDKHDKADSFVLADLTRVGYLPKVFLASAYERDLRALVNHRQAIVDRGRNLKLRLGALLREQRAFPPEAPEGLSRWSKAWVAWVKEGADLSESARWIALDLLAEIEHAAGKERAARTRLRAFVASDEKVKRLMEEPCVGEVTAWVLRAYVGRFDRFASGRKLSHYCGLSPRNASSGEKRSEGGLIKGCNKLLRSTLIQLAHRLARTEERWSKLAGSLRGRGKPACVAVSAVANRFVRGLWHRQKEGGTPGREENQGACRRAVNAGC